MQLLIPFPEIDYILRQSGAACYLGQPGLFAEAAKSGMLVPGLDRCFLTGALPGSASVSPFRSLLRAARRQSAVPPLAPDRVAAILYTSGTTARPKGAAHSHDTLAQTARVMRSALLDEDEVVVVMSSIAHMVGFAMVFLPALLNGATVAIPPTLAPRSVLETFRAVARHVYDRTAGRFPQPAAGAGGLAARPQLGAHIFQRRRLSARPLCRRLSDRPWGGRFAKFTA